MDTTALGIPFDIWASMMVLGSADALATRPVVDRPSRWARILLGYSLGVLCAAAALFPLVPWMERTFGDGLAGDVFVWAAISAVVSLASAPLVAGALRSGPSGEAG